MTRRWMVSGGSLLIGTTLAAWAAAQTSPTFSERFQQFRSGWGGNAPSEPAITAENTPEAQVAPPTEHRGMLPKVDPRALLPDSLFGRPTSTQSTPPAATTSQRQTRMRTDVKPATSAGMRANAQRRAGSAQAGQTGAQSAMLPGLSNSKSTSSTAGATAKPSAAQANANARTLAPITPVDANTRPSPKTAAAPARRSPEQRTPPNFDSEALRNELSSSFAAANSSTPAATESTTDPNEPTLADEFAAGLEREAETMGRSNVANTAPPSAATSTPSAPAVTDPIRLRPSTVSSRTATRTTTRPGADVPQANDRYAQPAFPSVGGLIGRKTETTTTPPTNADPAAPAADAPVIVSDDAAMNAFRQKSSESASDSPATRSSTFRPQVSSSPSQESSGRYSFAESTPTAPAGSALLVSNHAPAISSDIRGPQQITIGREAKYELRLKNTGSSAAEQLVATVRIPSWADVVTTTSTRGAIRQGEGSEPSSALQWQIDRLEANAEETITMTLIPRASRPLELGIAWTHAAADARTIVEVQEPKLRMSVSGPDEVLFGKPHVYRLTLSNPGTGTAENVKIDLLPPGGGRDSVSTHALGNLAPGESKSVEVELTARDAGKLNVQAIASADGGLTSEANKELFCRKPELEVDWRGPETQYAGTPATYFFRVRNPGTAAADNVAVRVAMPGGAEFVSASEGYRRDTSAGEIVWAVGSLGPGDDCYMELRCVVHTPGENQLRVAATTAEGDLVANKLAHTNVVALADLKLDVSDPAGPVLVGDEAVYEIRVTNRGASAAEEVNVVGLFSAGLEPETVEGTPYTATDGRVSFRTIRKLPAGQNVVLQIRARATQQGTHVFRAEVLCRDLEIKLAAEETTRFYENTVMHEHSLGKPTMIGSKEANVVR